MQHLSKIFKIEQVTTSGYRPQANGALERSHLALIEYIRQYIEEYDDWDLFLPFAMFSYNTRIHESTNFSPHELKFGKPARVPSAFPTDNLDTYPSYLSELVTKLNDLRELSAKHLIDSKYRSKKYYDVNAKTHNYAEGSLVYVLKEPRMNKLEKTYVGPYKLIKVLENHNAILENEHGKRLLKHLDKVKPAFSK